MLQGLHPLSQAAPLLRDVLAARRTRHPHSSGPARTRARGNDHDLHTRIEDGRRPSSRVCQPLATGATVEIPGPSCGGRALFKWPCWLPLSCRLPMSASGRERSSIPHDQHGAPSIHPSTPQTKRSGGDSDSRKDIQSGAASNAVVRAAGELPVAARPAWRCKSEGFSDPSPASYPVVQAAYNMERSTFHAIGRLQHAARRYPWVSQQQPPGLLSPPSPTHRADPPSAASSRRGRPRVRRGCRFAAPSWAPRARAGARSSRAGSPSR